MAQKSGCDLIAMSSRGRIADSSGLLGSVTYRIMHESPVPVLAEAALPHAAAIAARMDMRISLLRVLSVDRTFAGAGFLGLIEQATAGDDMEVEAYAYLAAEVRRLRGEGLEVEANIVRGRAATKIIELARGAERNMIALATHGRTGANRLLMGSVAEVVVKESGDPVLIVRPPNVVTPDPARVFAPAT